MPTCQLAPEIVMTIETITPEMAQRYLRTMRFNRAVDAKKVFDYAVKMLTGGWNDLSRYIEFTEEGDLINGQHRLYAIIQSGIPQRFVVVRNLPIAAR